MVKMCAVTRSGDLRALTRLQAPRAFSTASPVATSVTRSFPASFVRGGTSNGLLSSTASVYPPTPTTGSPSCLAPWAHQTHTPASSTAWVPGSRRRVRSWLSKSLGVQASMLITLSFRSVSKMARSTWLANCGNMSSAVGPWSWDHGLVASKSVTLKKGDPQQQ